MRTSSRLWSAAWLLSRGSAPPMKQAAGEASRPGKDARENRSAVQRPSRASLRARGAEIIGRRQKFLKRIDRGVEKAQPLQNAGNALRQLGDPRLGRTRN